jgi:hypothetical protein
MLIYWIFFLTLFLISLMKFKYYYLNISLINKAQDLKWKLTFIFITLFIGLRHNVGGDWINYIELFNFIKAKNFLDVLSGSDPFYGLINWILSDLEFGPYWVNLICGYLFTWGLFIFCRAQPQPWLALAVSLPYLITVVAMGYTRQGVAIGIVMAGLVFLQNGSMLKFTICLFAAIAFHKSAIILLPLAIFSGKKNFYSLIGILFFGTLMFFLFVVEYINSLFSGYVTDQYESSGALIRVLMNAFPAALFLVFRGRFKLSKYEESFWSWMSISALFILIILFISPSSTAIDRIALYWIPLQLFVFSRLPQAMGKNFIIHYQYLFLIFIYYSLIFYVWLFHAQYRVFWIPYRFLPIELIFNSF